VGAGESSAALSGLAIPRRFSILRVVVTFDQKNKPVRFASNERALTTDPPRIMASPASPSKQ
jgi:hypothetical protein